MTHQEFIQKIPLNYLKEVTLLSDFINYDSDILVDTKYGKCNASPISIIRNQKPSIIRAVNKHDYFLNKLKDLNKDYKENKFEVISSYENWNTELIVKNHLSTFKVSSTNLFNNVKLCLQNCLNPTEYWINMAREIHGDLYDYSLSGYVDSKNKVSNKKHFELQDEIMKAFIEFKNTALIYCCTIFEGNVKSFKCNYYEKELKSIDLEYEDMKLTLRIVK